MAEGGMAGGESALTTVLCEHLMGADSSSVLITAPFGHGKSVQIDGVYRALKEAGAACGLCRHEDIEEPPLLGLLNALGEAAARAARAHRLDPQALRSLVLAAIPEEARGLAHAIWSSMKVDAHFTVEGEIEGKSDASPLLGDVSADAWTMLVDALAEDADFCLDLIATVVMELHLGLKSALSSGAHRIILLVDHVEYSGRLSRRLLSRLLDCPPRACALVVAWDRSQEDDSLPHPAGLEHAAEITLQGWNEEGLAHLYRALGGDEANAEAVASGLLEQGPLGIRFRCAAEKNGIAQPLRDPLDAECYRPWIEGLEPAGRRILALLALTRRAIVFDEALWQGILECNSAALRVALGPLLSEGFVVHRRGRIGLAHPVYRTILFRLLDRTELVDGVHALLRWAAESDIFASLHASDSDGWRGVDWSEKGGLECGNSGARGSVGARSPVPRVFEWMVVLSQAAMAAGVDLRTLLVPMKCLLDFWMKMGEWEAAARYVQGLRHVFPLLSLPDRARLELHTGYLWARLQRSVQALSAFRRALHVAGEARLEREQGAAMLFFAEEQIRLGRQEGAVHTLTQWLERFQGAGWREEGLRVLLQLGLLMLAEKSDDEAEFYFRKAEDMLRDVSCSPGLLRLITSVCDALIRRRAFSVLDPLIEAALEGAKGVVAADLKIWAGLAEEARGRIAVAERCLLEGLAVHPQTRIYRRAWFVHSLALAAFYNRQGDGERAKILLLELREVAKEAGRLSWEGALRLPFGVASRLVGDADAAMQWAREAVEERRLDGAHIPLMEALNELGVNAFHFAHFEEAQEAFLEAFERAEALGMEDVAGVTANNRARALEALGDTMEALVWYRRSLRYKESLGDHVSLRFSLMNLVGMFEEMGRLDMARECLTYLARLDSSIEHPDRGKSEAYLKRLSAVQGEAPSRGGA